MTACEELQPFEEPKEKVILGDCLIEMAKIEENSIDFIVTDPPYGLKFMGKQWDHGVPGINFWKEAMRICKPGAMMAAFGGSRTHHRLMCAIEDAGWEIRDVVMWLYGSGFPKSHNHFGFEGYGTALKPSHEPIILAMKPLDGTFAQNAEKWGVAGINIDDSRVGANGGTTKGSFPNEESKTCYGNGLNGSCEIVELNKGRWPANLILSEEAAELLDQMSGVLKSGSGNKNISNRDYRNAFGKGLGKGYGEGIGGDSGGASRFFYCAKASSAERNRGLEGLPLKECQTGCGGDMPVDDDGNDRDRFKKKAQNFHPTVKPLSLMKYLLKLLAPPGDPIVLDPFCGSGSTLVAAKELGIRAIGIEKSEEYCEIAKARVAFEEKEKFLQYEMNL